MKNGANPSKSGQAMVEFLLGLVGVMFLIVGLMQIREISISSLEMNIAIREELAEQLASGGSAGGGEFMYSSGAMEGEDGKMYTEDDKLQSGNSSDFFPDFLNNVGYSDDGPQLGGSLKSYLEEYDRPSRDVDAFEVFESVGGNMASTFDMRFENRSETIEVMPFLRSVLGKSSFTLERGVWMPELTGIMEEQ